MRLFVALEIPNETREALAALIAELKAKCPSAKWVRPAVMHVTLKFIGHVSEETLPAICDALAQVRAADPVDMRFRGLGFFPNEGRPRVFWCGVEASPNATSLAAEIDQRLANLGVQAETRPFSPHLTLARLDPDKLFSHGKPSPELTEILRAANDMATAEFGATRSTEFHLFESKTKPSGAEYMRLQTFPFTKAAN
jgi:RNA 2',3'-cyclic 3'-phosphodiesterase